MINKSEMIFADTTGCSVVTLSRHYTFDCSIRVYLSFSGSWTSMCLPKPAPSKNIQCFFLLL